ARAIEPLSPRGRTGFPAARPRCARRGRVRGRRRPHLPRRDAGGRPGGRAARARPLLLLLSGRGRADRSRAAMKVLVAGVGGLFVGDDAFGVEVVQQLLRSQVPVDARVVDAGIRGVHLAYELLEGYDALVLVDAMAHGELPGTVSIFERAWGD